MSNLHDADVTLLSKKMNSSTGAFRLSGAASAAGYRRLLQIISVTQGATGAAQLKFANHDTVSATFSGMTLLASASLANTVSGNTYMFRRTPTKRFFGFLVSALSGNIDALLLGLNSDKVPSAAAQGFTSVTDI